MKKLIKTASLVFFLMAAVSAWSQTFDELVNNLNAPSFRDKSEAVQALSKLDDPRVLPVLMAMTEGDLHYRKSDKKIVIATKTDNGFQLSDPLTGSDLGEVGKRDSKKIRTNNKLRGEINTQVAALRLSAPDKAVRVQSARDLIKNPTPDLREVLVAALEKEESAQVKELVSIALARIDINSDSQEHRLAAVEAMGNSVETEAVAELRNILEKDADGNYIEQDEKVTALAATKVEWVDTKLAVFGFTENVVFGLSLGSVLLLAAIGLAITFGVMGVINMAHGEMIMLGAYTTFAIQQIFPNFIDYSLFIAIPAAFLVSGSVGVVIERTVIRHLYGRPLDTLLATFGISLLLQQAVRVYHSNNVPVITPDWMAGSWVVNGALSFTYNRIYIFIFSLFVLGMLALLLKKTLLGLQMRAVTQNRAMANSMGIRSSRVDALTFGLGSGIAGIAGVAISQITNVGPNLGQSYIIDSFMVVVFGGVGNLLGTFFAGMGLGVVTKFLEPQVGAVVGKIMVLIFIILFIQWRPRGLFALKGRFVED